MNEPRTLDIAAEPTASRLDDCWNRIGIAGDRSCPELKLHVHCRNCPVFARAARSFFDRPAPPGYLDEWARWLSDEEYCDEERADASAAGRDAEGRRNELGVLIFRLGQEWLAFRTQAVVEATLPKPVHRVPHRSNAVLKGLVNLRGQLQLCFSLHGLLGSAPQEAAAGAEGGRDHGASPRERLIVLRDRTEIWAFAADELHGVEHFARGSLQGVPSTLANTAVSYSQAVIPWNDRSVGFLDENRVFAALRSIGQ
ncbi:chemotaxis protein CheW [Planctomyces sp. SH-PL62]|uniref:chemotaxis protein CheW n=1 Tax=Planctomyces sp. SH-PL62 TaxID=1636152 RepID=UPI00078E143A|nr:chemotaxis protein CheW [Planctomyces sp. SH-PL62]AMV37846.1 CheW-like domain protein [Planctomyces sp. SH-PL62]